MERKAHLNGPIMIAMCVVYLGMLVLFATQTWGLVDWLFPTDQLGTKLLTLGMFDIMAFMWGCVLKFYRFHSRGAWQAVVAGAVITFLLSFVASILYMSIHNIFRFHLAVDQGTVNFGYGVSILAVMVNIIVGTFFVVLELNGNNPHLHYFEVREQQANMMLDNTQARNASLPSVNDMQATRVLANNDYLPSWTSVHAENNDVQANNGYLPTLSSLHVAHKDTQARNASLPSLHVEHNDVQARNAYFPYTQQENNDVQASTERNGTQASNTERNARNGTQARKRTTKQQVAALAVINKYGQQAILSNLEGYAKEAGISARTLKRYAEE